MNISSGTTAPDDVAPDAEMIAIYADVVFGYCDGWVPVRALAEKGAGDGPPHVPFIEADGTLAAKLALQATWASGVGMALFVAPGTVAAPGDARADSILQTQVVRFTNWLTEIDRLSGPIAAIWFEEVRRHAGTDASHIYGGLMATLTAWAELRGVPYEGVPVGTIKRHATGKGNADKEAMIAAVRARGFSPADDNEADAIALLLWAIQTNGGVA